MTKEEAKQKAYEWIEKEFMDRLVAGDDAQDDEYDLTSRLGFNPRAVYECHDPLRYLDAVQDLNLIPGQFRMSFSKKSRNSGTMFFFFEILERPSASKMKIVLEMYEDILHSHRIDEPCNIVNSGWFVTDSATTERPSVFYFFTPGFNVYNRNWSECLGSFDLEVSLTNFIPESVESVMASIEETTDREIFEEFEHYYL